MHLYPRFQYVIARLPIRVVKTHLGYYLGESAKLIDLYSNCGCVKDVLMFKLRNYLPTSSGVVKAHTGVDGRRQVSGDVGLKGTQAYPQGFGNAVALMYDRNRESILAWAKHAYENSIAASSDFTLEWVWQTADDMWPDADLGGVFGILLASARANGHVG